MKKIKWFLIAFLWAGYTHGMEPAKSLTTDQKRNLFFQQLSLLGIDPTKQAEIGWDSTNSQESIKTLRPKTKQEQADLHLFLTEIALSNYSSEEIIGSFLAEIALAKANSADEIEKVDLYKRLQTAIRMVKVSKTNEQNPGQPNPNFPNGAMDMLFGTMIEGIKSGNDSILSGEAITSLLNNFIYNLPEENQKQLQISSLFFSPLEAQKLVAQETARKRKLAASGKNSKRHSQNNPSTTTSDKTISTPAQNNTQKIDPTNPTRQASQTTQLQKTNSVVNKPAASQPQKTAPSAQQPKQSQPNPLPHNNPSEISKKNDAKNNTQTKSKQTLLNPGRLGSKIPINPKQTDGKNSSPRMPTRHKIILTCAIGGGSLLIAGIVVLVIKHKKRASTIKIDALK